MKLIPLLHNSKKPLRGEDWHKRISDDPREHEKWLNQGLNVGFPLTENGCSVVDFDDKAEARKWWKIHHEIVKVAVITRRGLHGYFSGTTKTRKFEFGDIKGNGYTVYPFSIVDGYMYRFVPGYEWGRELLPFPEELFPCQLELNCTFAGVSETIRDVRRYIGGIRAVSRSGGHNATFRVACCLRDSGISEAEALAEMIEWNQTNAEPPWTVKELLHKVRDAYAKVMQ